MMKSTSWLVFGMLAWSVACPVQAGEITATSKLLCALSEVHECVAVTGCERVRPQEIGLHTSFISVDLQKREIRAKGTEDITVADKRFEVEDKFVLAGAEVDDMVGDGDRLGLVLDDEHRVAEVTQVRQRLQESLVVALV